MAQVRVLLTRNYTAIYPSLILKWYQIFTTGYEIQYGTGYFTIAFFYNCITDFSYCQVFVRCLSGFCQLYFLQG